MQTYREKRSPCKGGGRNWGDVICKPRSARDCWQPPQARTKTWDHLTEEWALGLSFFFFFFFFSCKRAKSFNEKKTKANTHGPLCYMVSHLKNHKGPKCILAPFSPLYYSQRDLKNSCL
jgi:hypothetical protein